MGHNRRRSERLPVGFYVEQIVDDDPHRCFTMDLSALGIYLERIAEPLQRNSSVVQLEIPLPNTGETLWAKGEVVYDRFDAIFHGTAIRFAGMARAHQRLLRDWLRESRREPWPTLQALRPAPHAAITTPGWLVAPRKARVIRVRRPATPATAVSAASWLDVSSVPEAPTAREQVSARAC